MATYYLRPSADLTVGHSKSTGSNGYALINEEVADDDAKYIYLTTSGSSKKSTTSTFTVSGTIPAGSILGSAKVFFRARSTGGSNNTSTATVGDSTTGAKSLSTSYSNFEADINISDLTVSGTTVSARLQLDSSGTATKSNDYQVRITQAYIQVEAAPLVIYYKQNGTWSAKKAYQKVDGEWVFLTGAPSGFTNGDMIIEK